jgi:exopolyphosphatase/guanosine-5'-triphosphate,3'-diphosphate pyrophosphatase
MNTALTPTEFLSVAGLSASDRIAVVDIGSNSVRLVVYNRAARVLIPLFNEKIFCGIGRHVVSTGLLDEEGVARAIEALARYRELIASVRASRVEAVATAAVRDAKNGRGFVEHAESVLGAPIRILPGEEEARLSALGVISGIPDAEGVVGDLGGGSLELVRVSEAKTGEAITLPLGPLRLIDMGFASLKAARGFVDDEIARIGWLKKAQGKSLYLVGGSWRNLARLHLEQATYPLTVLHQYTVDGGEASVFCRSVSKLGKKSLEGISGIPKKRLEGLPYAALVLERLIEALKAKRIVVSAHGLREGLVAAIQGPEIRAIDPVVAAAQDLCVQMARDPALCAELAEWTAPLFPWETPGEKRLRVAACWLCDIAWRVHPEYRSEVVFTRILGEQFSGLDHTGRAFLALALHERYPDAVETEEMTRVRAMMSEAMRDNARILGRALRLGITLSGACAGTLPKCPLTLNGDKLHLQVPKTLRALYSETAQKRLEAVADALERSHRVSLI